MKKLPTTTWRRGKIECTFTQAYGLQIGALTALQQQGECGWQNIIPPVRIYVSELKYLKSLEEQELHQELMNIAQDVYPDGWPE
jgi:hypothetical protein